MRVAEYFLEVGQHRIADLIRFFQKYCKFFAPKVILIWKFKFSHLTKEITNSVLLFISITKSRRQIVIFYVVSCFSSTAFINKLNWIVCKTTKRFSLSDSSGMYRQIQFFQFKKFIKLGYQTNIYVRVHGGKQLYRVTQSKQSTWSIFIGGSFSR